MEGRVRDKLFFSVARVWLRSDQDDMSNGFITKFLFLFFHCGCDHHHNEEERGRPFIEAECLNGLFPGLNVF
jgi:hypothetical protein